MAELGKRTVQDLDLDEGTRVLERVDFNVPLDDEGNITDESRIEASLPTIELLLEKGVRLVLCAHLGRPEGRDESTSLAPASKRLDELIDASVEQADDVVGADAKAKAEALEPGSVLVLQNLRWEEGEEENDPELAKALAGFGDVYVNDAFGAAHRAHASTAGVPEHLPSAAGLLLEREVTTLRRIVEEPERPFVVVLGGLKVSGKIGLINRFLDVADTILLGGAMSYQFFKAMGRETGDSYLDEEGVELANEVLKKTDRGDTRAELLFPVDLVAGDDFSEDANVKELEGTDVPEGWEALDIGKRTREVYSDHIREAGTVFWNGPMGAFEMEPFSNGTRAVAETVAAAPGTTVAGGGDSVSALQEFGLAEQVTHLSTGGGASLELLEGKDLPGVEALDDA